MRYTHDLTDAEWHCIEYCFPKPNQTGRPRQHPYRELLNAMFYLARTACQWRNLPKDFSPWRTVYHDYRLWTRSDLLIAIHRDPTQDPVLRDYALQHLVVWYEQGAPDTPKAREQIRAVLEAAARGHDSLAGTALLGLHRLSAREPAFEAAKIDRLALHLVRSGATDPATRITAVAVCAERGLTEALPNIAALLDGPASVPLRLAAQAAWNRLSAPAQTHAVTSAGEDNAVPSSRRGKPTPLALKRQPD